jgi:hypothetical protein
MISIALPSPSLPEPIDDPSQPGRPDRTPPRAACIIVQIRHDQLLSVAVRRCSSPCGFQLRATTSPADRRPARLGDIPHVNDTGSPAGCVSAVRAHLSSALDRPGSAEKPRIVLAPEPDPTAPRDGSLGALFGRRTKECL